MYVKKPGRIIIWNGGSKCNGLMLCLHLGYDDGVYLGIEAMDLHSSLHGLVGLMNRVQSIM
jgi:hypothetical protein